MERSMFDIQAERESKQRQALRDQSLHSMLKRQRTQQPAGKCPCGRTISGNKTHCANCANQRSSEHAAIQPGG